MSRSFPGTAGNYMTVGDVAAIDITGTLLTVAVWIKPTSGNWIVVAKDGGAANNLQYRIWLPGSNLWNFDIGDATSIDTAQGGAASYGAWQLLTGRKNGTAGTPLDVFKGATSLAPTASARTIANQSAVLTFGTRAVDNFGPYNGLMAHVAIWNVALTDGEIASLAAGTNPLAVQAANLKGYWPMTGGVSPEPDMSGNGNPATIVGTVNTSSDNPTVFPVGVPQAAGADSGWWW